MCWFLEFSPPKSRIHYGTVAEGNKGHHFPQQQLGWFFFGWSAERRNEDAFLRNVGEDDGGV